METQEERVLIFDEIYKGVHVQIFKTDIRDPYQGFINGKKVTVDCIFMEREDHDEEGYIGYAWRLSHYIETKLAFGKENVYIKGAESAENEYIARNKFYQEVLRKYKEDNKKKSEMGE